MLQFLIALVVILAISAAIGAIGAWRDGKRKDYGPSDF